MCLRSLSTHNRHILTITKDTILFWTSKQPQGVKDLIKNSIQYDGIVPDGWDNSPSSSSYGVASTASDFLCRLNNNLIPVSTALPRSAAALVGNW